jgi:ERCC4-type nuclease
MIITIDVREAELITQIKLLVENSNSFKQHIIKTEALPIGDIVISNDTEDKIIIERKTIADLLASIKDGRYEEQSYRLNGLPHHNHNIVYLIEGDVNRINRFKNNFALDKQIAYSSMFSLNYYKGFSVFRSFSLEETATIICNMAYKLDKEVSGKKAYYQNTLHTGGANIVKTECVTNLNDVTNNDVTNLNDNDITNNIVDDTDDSANNCKNYVNVIKKIKKENITPDNIGEIMLCQIPGISTVTALAIMAKYNTLPNLIKEIENNNDCLNNISYSNDKGQQRKINKTSISNIVKFLLKK